MPVCIDSFRRKCLLARMFRMHKGNELPIKPRTFSNDVLCIPILRLLHWQPGDFSVVLCQTRDHVTPSRLIHCFHPNPALANKGRLFPTVSNSTSTILRLSFRQSIPDKILYLYLPVFTLHKFPHCCFFFHKNQNVHIDTNVLSVLAGFFTTFSLLFILSHTLLHRKVVECGGY
jgi:hypothetical protein